MVFHKGKPTRNLLKSVQSQVDFCHGTDLLKMPTQMNGPGGEGEVADVEGGGVREGAYLSFGFAVVRAVPVKPLFGCVGVEEGRGAGRRG